MVTCKTQGSGSIPGGSCVFRKLFPGMSQSQGPNYHGKNIPFDLKIQTNINIEGIHAYLATFAKKLKLEKLAKFLLENRFAN